MPFCFSLFRAHHPHRLRMLLGEGQILGLPELCFDNVVAMLFGELFVGCAALKQALGILIQRAALLFQGDDQIPIDFFG